jgi:YgiT-type zinc finger domain-containing protein
MLRMLFDGDLTCPVCRLGRLESRSRVYLRRFGNTLVSVPNTPAWECDVCHYRQFDPTSIQRIEVLVGQAGPPPNRYKSTPVEPLEAKTSGKAAKGSRTGKDRAKAGS